MATTVFNRGLDVLNPWTSGTFRALLLQGAIYVPNKDDDYVATAVAAAAEVVGAGYTRQVLAGKTRTIDDTLDRITYDCSDFGFGNIAAGENVDSLVLYLFVTNDADSILIAHYTLGTIATTGNAFPVVVGSAGMIYTDQGA
jgi:hypothetical protein